MKDIQRPTSDVQRSTWKWDAASPGSSRTFGRWKLSVGRWTFVALLSFALRVTAQEQRFVFEKAEMGVPFRITLYAPDAPAAKSAADAAFERVAVLNGILSDYDPDSELSRLGRDSGRGNAAAISTALWRVLERSQLLASQTDGAFDITVGPFVHLWRRTRRTRELPALESIAAARARVGWQHLRLDTEARTAELLRPDMRLDVGGIAKGFAADEALGVLKAHGFPRALVAASGDLVAGDPPPGEVGWRVQVAALDVPGAPPAVTLLLANRAVSTSGDAFQYVEIGGVRYSHIVDPRTGLGLADQSLVTVVAADGLTADGLDTAIDVLGPERGLELLARWPGTAARIVRKPGERVEVAESPGWRELSKTTP